MKQITLTIFSIIILTSLVSALNIYPGETIIFQNEMGIENLVYTITGNSSEVNPFDVQVNPINITITFPQDMNPDSFDIIFLEEQTKTVVQTITVGGGGSSGGTRTIYRDKIIPEIFEKEVIKEVPGETINNTVEVEKVVKGSSRAFWFTIIVMIIFIIFLIAMLIWR